MKKLLYILVVIIPMMIISCNKDLEIIYFEISPTEAEIEISDEIAIKASVSFGGKDSVDIFWESSDYNVAEVNEFGLVKGKGIGTAIISVKCADQIKECRITVAEKIKE